LANEGPFRELDFSPRRGSRLVDRARKGTINLLLNEANQADVTENSSELYRSQEKRKPASFYVKRSPKTKQNKSFFNKLVDDLDEKGMANSLKDIAHLIQVYTELVGLI